MVYINIDWGDKKDKPLINYPKEVLKNIAYRLFIGAPNIGGKVTLNSIVKGYTEYKNMDGLIGCIFILPKVDLSLTGLIFSG